MLLLIMSVPWPAWTPSCRLAVIGFEEIHSALYVLDPLQFAGSQHHVAYRVYHGVGPLTRTGKSYALLIGVVLLLTVGLVLYSQVFAFVWDEGYHVLAAQLIARGKRPYLDFCFPQTPLNAYWNAALLRVFGDTWRVIHGGAALLTGGTIMLIADYVYFRFPVRQWRSAAALAAALPMAGSVLVVKFATA